MVSFGQFPENGQGQMTYIIYLIEVWRNTDKKLIAEHTNVINFIIHV
jgi:hypothetical protein